MKTRALKYWTEAMRLRTLPVSAAGVVAACGYAFRDGCFRLAPAVICLIFALLAQIASNFANEYYDYAAGLDKAGRDGPRRGVTEGDITPQAMLRATYLTLAVACMVGLMLVAWGGWWLVIAGIFIVLGALAYSAGPYPLSHHGLGEVMVVLFFGIAPVCLCYYVQSGTCNATVAAGSVGIGLMAANLLIVNNYRDHDDDKAVGKHTLCVLIGCRATASLYLLNAVAAVALSLPVWLGMPVATRIIPVLYLALAIILWRRLRCSSGPALNPLLGMTAMAMFAYALAFALAAYLIS
ncbi:MAG: 1,4-dihydroxy-2-naphthoate octaprenyltransferase [Muribaculaceae bacterium]|nr:1,4-dihydroxy-2-naphthoate octaprenyltransferase [Muribaculaceae bacterium]